MSRKKHSPEWGNAPPKYEVAGVSRPGTGFNSHQPSLIRGPVPLLVVVLAVLIWSPALAAEMRTYGPFSVETPAGWEADYEEGCLTMVHEGPKSLMKVCSLPLGGQPFGEAVLEMAEVFDSVPKRDADGDYSFVFRNEDLDLTVHAVVTEEDGAIKLVGVAGEHPDLEKILSSLEEK